MMEECQFVENFKAFEGLTHLEIDLGLLKPSAKAYPRHMWSGRRFEIVHLPRSLADYLPVSIEVVTILPGFNYKDFRVFRSLLDPIPSQRAQVPNLQKIVIKLRAGRTRYDGGRNFCCPSSEINQPGEEDYRTFRVWSRPLAAIGIDLVVDWD
jgi:hypothetical protein